MTWGSAAVISRKSMLSTSKHDLSQRISRLGRILFFLAAAVLALQIIPWQPVFAVQFLPGLSPLLAACSALAQRSFTVMSLLAVPLVIVSLFRGRWFCRHLCPTGFLAERVGHIRPHAARRCHAWPRLNRWLVLLAIASAAVGYPLLLWLDPLAIFNGFFSVWTRPVMKSENYLALGLLLVLGLSLWRPGVWCYRICPLGFILEFLGSLGRWLRSLTHRKFEVATKRHKIHKFLCSGCASLWRMILKVAAFLPDLFNREEEPAVGDTAHPDRRAFLFTMAAGVFSVLLWKIGGTRRPIRPPGVVSEDQFKMLCIRCGSCIRTCPQRILHADLNALDPAGLLTPVVRIEPGYCFEFCKQCADVCPTRAIQPLTLWKKQQIAIGLAGVDRSRCIAWSQAQYCMVCAEFCPFQAVRAVQHGGVNCPEVDPEVCRGCGLCQVQCPANPKAIIVNSRPQKSLKPVEI